MTTWIHNTKSAQSFSIAPRGSNWGKTTLSRPHALSCAIKFVKLYWVKNKHFQASAPGMALKRRTFPGLPKLAALENCNYGNWLLIQKRFQIGAGGALAYI
jgi:hypothetical protein